MRFVKASEARARWAEIGDMVQEGDYVVLTKHGKPFAVLIGLDAEQVELGLSREMWRFIRKSRRQKAVGKLRDLREELGI